MTTERVHRKEGRHLARRWSPLGLTALFTGLTLGLPAQAQGARNLLVNADFESPPVDPGTFGTFAAIDGWTATSGSLELQNDVSSLTAVSNDQHLELDSLSVVTQSVLSTPGQTYALSFAFSPRPGAGDAEFEVRYAGVLLETIDVPSAGAQDWTYRSYHVTGASPSDAVEFRDLTGGSLGVLLDDCFLVPYDPAVNGQLLRNRDFEEDPLMDPDVIWENPVFEGWTSLQNSEIEIRDFSNTPDVYQGTQLLDLDEEWGVGQYVECVAGETYTLSFAASPNPAADYDQSFEVRFGGALVDTVTVLESNSVDWQVYSYQVSSDDPKTMLEFQDLTGGGNGAWLDLTSLIGPRPEPDTSGEVLSFKRIRRDTNKGLRIDTGDMFARSATMIGDVDGDGVQDLAVGAIGDDDGGNNTGAVWILFMNADRSLKDVQKISENKGNLGVNLDAADGFGRALTSLGDLDGDGVPDIAVGANRDDDGASNAGAVYVLFLNSDGTVKDRHKISATSGDNLDYVPGNRAEFGGSVACMGDMDGDGANELAIGSRHADSVQICFMNTDGTVRESTNLTWGTNGFTGSEAPSGSWGELWGMSCANMGDFDGDGTDDLLVGGYCRMIYGQWCTGAQYMLLLNPDGTCKKWFYYGPETINPQTHQYVGIFDEFAVACSAAGDVDGDGVLDMLVGAHREGSMYGPDLNEGTMNGAAYVFFLNENGTLKRSMRIGDREGGWDFKLSDGVRWGESTASLGDWDGNGKVDVAIGSRFMGNRGELFLIELDGGGQPALSAGFSASPILGAAPLNVTFTNQSSGQITSYAWDFGDGNTSTEESPAHTYLADGTYTVSLAVANGAGDEDELTQPDLITVGGMTGIRPLGCGVNPAGSLTLISGSPSIGDTLVLGVDNPLGTQAIGSRPVIQFSWRADGNDPCGTLIADRNMAGPGLDGERLLRQPYFRSEQGAAWQGPGIPSEIAIPIPNNPNLIGRSFYVQGRMFDDSPGAAIPNAFADAFEVTFQP